MPARPLALFERAFAFFFLLLFAAVAHAAPGTYLGKTLTCLPGGQSAAHRIVVQPDGKMISAGYAYFGTQQYSMTRYNTDGSLDTTYGQNQNGTQLEPLGPGNGEAWSAALTSDGKLVVGGFVRSDKNRFGIARFNADGTLDLSFGGGGAATSVGAGDAGGYAMAIDASGKVVQGGYSIGPTGKKVFTLVRYNAGTTSLDTSFGTGGTVVFPEGSADETIYSMLIQSDGSIVVMGSSPTYGRIARLSSSGAILSWGATFLSGGFTGGWDLAQRSDGFFYTVGSTPDGTKGAVVLLNTSGTLDNVFGGGTGLATFSVPNSTAATGYGVVALGTGPVVVSGSYQQNAAGPGMFVTRLNGASGAVDTTFGASGFNLTQAQGVENGYGLALRSNGNFVVAGGTGANELIRAVTSTGALDTSFAGGTKVTATGCEQAAGYASAKQADGKIVVAGAYFQVGTTNPLGMAITRYNTDGTRDTTFNGKGYTQLGSAMRANAVAIDGSGRIVVGGYRIVGGTNAHVMNVQRLNPDGSVDTTFNGLSGGDIPATSSQEEINALATLSDGSIIAAGLKSGGSFLDSVVAKLTPTGALDTTFGSSGEHVVSMSTGSDQFNAVGIQSDGKIVATGWLEISGSQDSFGVVRFNANGSLDTTFGSGGQVTVTFGTQTAHANAMLIQPADGKIVAGGQVFGTSTWDFALARLNTNGTLDTTFGNNGLVQSDFGNHNIIFALAQLTNGDILGAGTNGDLFGLAQYLPNGTLDTTFGTNGVVTQQVNAGSPDDAYGVSIGSDGTIYAAGNLSKMIGLARFAGGTGTLATASVNLASSANPSTTGQSVTFTATLTGSAGTPTGTVTFNDGGTAISGCSGIAVTNGAAACATSALAAGTHSITAAYSGNSAYGAATSSAITQTVNATVAETNWALASNGGVASASSQLNGNYPVSAINNNERAGVNWSAGGGWADATPSQYPDWVELDFSGAKLIDKVVVYTLQDNWQSPVEPTDTMTFTQYGITDFTVQGWTGSAWQTLATVSGNNLVKRTVTFTAFNTTKIRVNVSNSLNGYSRITEVEAWGVPGTSTGPTPSNVALASAGATAFASSTFGPGFAASNVLMGNAAGTNWSNGGGWADGTSGTYPDWIEVDFNGTQVLDHVVVYTVQDNWQNPSQPTDTMTFTQYGITDFTVQGWDGSTWQVLGTVTGNNLVKRTVTFNTPFTTSKIRVVVNNSLNGYSRITSIEAWGTPSTTQQPVNVALASNGGVASASSQLSTSFPVSAINNGDRAGINWSAGGGWADATPGQYPDWVEVDFSNAASLTSVVVYTLQDNWQSPVEPTDTMTFTQYGVTDFTVQGWDGTQWVTLGTVTGNNLVKRTVTFSAFTTSKIRVNVNNSLNGYSRITEVEAWGTPSTTQQPVNVALASNGGMASASSQLSTSFPVSAINNGERAGTNWSAGGGWADATPGQYPDWVEVDFSKPASLTSVVVYTLQDNWQSPVEPTDTMTFTQYGVTDFTVQGWDGTQWVTLGTVTGNNLVKRTVTFSAFTTSKIRVNVNNSLNGYSRITEVEAWGTPQQVSGTNVALAANGGVAIASSSYSSNFPVSSVNNGDRKGLNWSAGGGWADGTPNTYPDWVEIDFNGSKTLNTVNVYTLQDNWQNPVEPTDTMTFTQYGITDFQVQAWDGSAWQTVGTASGNNLVKRSFAVSVTTTKIRVLVTNAMASLSRITEIEAFGN